MFFSGVNLQKTDLYPYLTMKIHYSFLTLVQKHERFLKAEALLGILIHGCFYHFFHIYFFSFNCIILVNFAKNVSNIIQKPEKHGC